MLTAKHQRFARAHHALTYVRRGVLLAGTPEDVLRHLRTWSVGKVFSPKRAARHIFEGDVSGCAFDPTGRFLAVGRFDRTICLYDSAPASRGLPGGGGASGTASAASAAAAAAAEFDSTPLRVLRTGGYKACVGAVPDGQWNLRYAASGVTWRVVRRALMCRAAVCVAPGRPAFAGWPCSFAFAPHGGGWIAAARATTSCACGTPPPGTSACAARTTARGCWLCRRTARAY